MATFGYTSNGASSSTEIDDDMRLKTGDVLDDGVVDSVHVYCRDYQNNSWRIKAVITDINGDILTNGVGGSADVDGYLTLTWTTLTYSSKPSVSHGTTYHAAFIPNSGTIYYAYDTGGASGVSKRDTSNSYDTPQNTGEMITSTDIVSIYATYTLLKFETLTDNFNDNSINATLWNDDNCSETGGQMVVTANTSTGTYNGITSTSHYDLTESSAFIQLVNAGDTSLSFTTYILELYNDTVDLYWAIEYGATDEIVAYKSPDSVNYTEKYRATYSSTDHKWFRIREASGTVYWDTSADGSSWTNRASDATGYTLTSLTAFFGVGNPGSGSTTVTFDNFNIVPEIIYPLAINFTGFVDSPAEII